MHSPGRAERFTAETNASLSQVAACASCDSSRPTGIRTLRTEVFQLLEGRQHPGQTQHLYVVAGWLSGLAAHVSLDLGHQPSAATLSDGAHP